MNHSKFSALNRACQSKAQELRLRGKRLLVILDNSTSLHPGNAQHNHTHAEADMIYLRTYSISSLCLAFARRRLLDACGDSLRRFDGGLDREVGTSLSVSDMMGGSTTCGFCFRGACVRGACFRVAMVVRAI